MPVVVSNVTPGFGADLYDKVADKLGLGEGLPEGCRLHIAGPVDEGWRVITVWDSRDAFGRFRDERMIPAIQEVAGDEAPTPRPDVREVHRLITA
jgi:hypothetical protein